MVVSLANPAVFLGINSATDLSGQASRCPERWRHLRLWPIIRMERYAADTLLVPHSSMTVWVQEAKKVVMIEG